MLTKRRLDELYIYQQDTGSFVRRTGRGGKAAGTSAGYKNKFGYIAVAVDGREFRRSHLVWLAETGSLPDEEIDHIDRCRSNDRFNNLRLATRKQNRWNTGAKNIYWKPKVKKYEAQVDNTYLGRFSTLAEAQKSVSAATLYRGEFSSHREPLDRQITGDDTEQGN